MSRNHFDQLWKHICFSEQTDKRPEGMSSETYRWKLIDDFVKNSNDHCETMFIPSSRIYVDEYISRWYGLGGNWINIGLPMYIAIERKPENRLHLES